MLRRACFLFVAAIFVYGGAGCATSRRENLEKVARDWCETIRASQVMPVYPPHEDLQVGDVFLVQATMSQEEEDWKDRGYLPLPRQVTRLHQLDFDTFYQPAYWEGTYQPGDTGHERPVPGVVERDPKTGRFTNVRAPRAAFPSYHVEVDLGAGLTAALPIKGFMVGLGMLHAESGTASVLLSDAYTYGLPEEEILGRLAEWAENNQPALAQIYEAQAKEERWNWTTLRCEPERAYLRVITRVFLVSKIDVSITADRAGALGVDVKPVVGIGGKPAASVPQKAVAAEDGPAGAPDAPGNGNGEEAAAEEGEEAPAPADTTSGAGADSGPKPVVLLKLKPGETAENYQAMADAFAEALHAQGVGASFRFAYATGRTVGMEETFDRPIVIGYHGFDVPIIADGKLGMARATYQRIENKQEVDPTAKEAPEWFKPAHRKLYTQVQAFRKKWVNLQDLPRQVAAIATLAEAFIHSIDNHEFKVNEDEQKKRFNDVLKWSEDLLAKPTVPEEAAQSLLERFLTRVRHLAGSDSATEEQAARLLRETDF